MLIELPWSVSVPLARRSPVPFAVSERLLPASIVGVGPARMVVLRIASHVDVVAADREVVAGERDRVGGSVRDGDARIRHADRVLAVRARERPRERLSVRPVLAVLPAADVGSRACCVGDRRAACRTVRVTCREWSDGRTHAIGPFVPGMP